MSNAGLRALPPPDIPKSLAEVTTPWLTAVLRAGGFLKESSVVSFTSETLGEGEGFVGQLARVRLSLDRPEAGAPETLIAKFPIGLDQNRGLGEALGAYDREIRFYNELAPRVPIKKPVCYYAAMDANPMAGREEQFLGFLEKMPRWVIRILIPLGMWFAARSPRRYALLLEDLGGARLGDQVAGCTPEEAGVLLREIARVHAAWWEHESLATLGWIARVDTLASYAHFLYERSRPAFFAGFGKDLPASFTTLADWLQENGIAVMRRLASRPITLVHGDFRLDNLFLHDDVLAAGRGEPVTLFDWQTMLRAPGVFDAAYFVTGNLPVATAAAVEGDLLRAYHDELIAHDVCGYDFEQCAADYRLSKIFLAYRLILGADLIDFSDERGTALIRGWLERLAALLPERYEDILDGMGDSRGL